MRSILILIVLILSACSNVKKSMGITQETPDEYAVMPQRRLEIPNNISIPEPNHEVTMIAAPPAEEDTKAILIGDNHSAKAGPHPTQAEQALLRHLPTKPESNIRMMINKDNKKPDRWGDQLLFWQKQVKGKPLDATTEAARLKKDSTSHEIISSGS